MWLHPGVVPVRFQFLIGRLETDKAVRDVLYPARMFQFLIGRLETQWMML